MIQAVAADMLDRGISLKAIARDLRERGVPTVTGAAWSAKTLREVLIKPAVAGLAVAARRLGGRPVGRDPGAGPVGAAAGPADRPVAAHQHQQGQRAPVAGVRVRDLRGVRRPDQGARAAGTGHPPTSAPSAATSAATPWPSISTSRSW